MFIIATIGFAVNIILLLMLGDSHDHGHSHGHNHDHGHHDADNPPKKTISQYKREAQILLQDSDDSLDDTGEHGYTSGDAVYGSCGDAEVPHPEAKKVININLSGAVLHAVSTFIHTWYYCIGRKRRIEFIEVD